MPEARRRRRLPPNNCSQQETSFLPVFALFALASLRCHRTGDHTRLPAFHSCLHTHTSLSYRHATQSPGSHVVVGVRFTTSGSLFRLDTDGFRCASMNLARKWSSSYGARRNLRSRSSKHRWFCRHFYRFINPAINAERTKLGPGLETMDCSYGMAWCWMWRATWWWWW